MKKIILLIVIIVWGIISFAQTFQSDWIETTKTEITHKYYVVGGTYQDNIYTKADLISRTGGNIVYSTKSITQGDTVFYFANGGTGNGSSYLSPSELNTINSFTFPSNISSIIRIKRGDIFNNTLIISKDSLQFCSYSLNGGSRNEPIISGFTTITSGWTDEGGGIYSKVINPESAPNMLTIDGVQMGMGRYPNTGSYLTYESASTNVSITDNELTGTPDWTGSEVVINKNDYRWDRNIITDHTNGTLTYVSLGSTNNASAGRHYFIQNDIKTLDQFGEWYYNSETSMIYVYFGATDPTTVTTKVSVVDNLITNSGYSNISVNNIRLEGANKSAALFGSGSDYAEFNKCDFQFIAGDGLTLSGNYNTVKNSTFANITGGNSTGWEIGGGAFFLGTHGSIKNSTFTDIGIIVGQAYSAAYTIPAIFTDDYPLFENNSIDSCGYMGVYFHTDAQYGTIQYNKFNHTATFLSDAAAIYMAYNKTGTKIQHNIILNSGGNGIYLDNTAYGVDVSDNIVLNSNFAGIKVHKGSYDTITNNTLYGNRWGIEYLNATTTQYFQGMVLDNNTVSISDSTQYLFNIADYYTGTVNYGTASENTYITHVIDSLDYYTNIHPTGAAHNHLNYFLDWKTLSGLDASSTELAYIYGNNSQIIYNDTRHPVTTILDGTWKDQYNIEHTSITLQPFTAIWLYQDPDVPSPVYVFGNIIHESFEGIGYENTWSETVGANTNNLVDEDNAEVSFIGGESQVLKTSSNTMPTANATSTQAYTFNTFTADDAVFADFWYQLLDQPASTSQTALICSLGEGANQALQIYVYKQPAYNAFYLRYYQNGALTTTYLSNVPVLVGKDYHIKALYDITNQRVFVSVNNTIVIDASLSGTLRNNVSTFYLGHLGSTTAISSYFDLVNLDTLNFSNY